MGTAVLVRAATLAVLLLAVKATTGCVTSIDSSSHMFGAGLTKVHNTTWVTYTQETVWKNKGDITKINMYYDEQSRCLKGVKPTFGYNSSNARRIGTEGTAEAPYTTVDLKLQGTEVFIKADYKFSDNCVEYLKLYTSRNRVLASGNSDSSSPLLTSWPVAAKGFLGFFKGFTDVANVNSRVGELRQLQLVWAVRDCPASPPSNPNPSAPPTNPNPSAPPTNPNPSAPPSNPNPSAPPANPNPSSPPDTPTDTNLPASPPASSPTPDMNPPANTVPSPAVPVPSPTGPVPDVRKCAPAAKLGCSAGKCPSSTCPLTGLGLKVPMLCYGINTQILPLQNFIKPCTNLACKLDKPGCQSFGILGVGSYCTGTVVAMDEPSKLHPIAKLLVGFPCVEHTGPLVDIIPAISSAENKGVYMAKAWQTCDCMQGVATVIQTMLSKNASLAADITVPDMGAVLTKIFNITLPDCNLEDMLKQWTSAIAIKLPLPKLVVPDLKALALKAIIPDFKLPCLIVPDISLPLVKLPEALKHLPLFTIHAKHVAAVSKLLNVTTLATLLVPPTGASDVVASAQTLSLPDLSIDGLKTLAASFVANTTQNVGLDGLQTLLSFKMANLTNLLKAPTTINKLDLNSIISQWVAANTLNIPLPTLQLGDMKITALKVLVPGLKLPCLVVHKAAAAFVMKAASELPVFVLPDSALKGVGQLLPNLTSLATVLVDKNVQTTLPTLHLGDITVANFTKVALKLSSALLPNVTIPGLPAAPSLINIQSVNFGGLSNFFSNLEQAFKNITTVGSSDAVKQLETTLGEVASKILPDELEAAFAQFQQTAAAALQQLQSTLGQAVSAVLPDSVEAMFSSVGPTDPEDT